MSIFKEKQIEKILKKILKKKIKNIDFKNLDLTKSDQIDSFDILNILIEIEKNFKIKFSNNDYKKNNFGKIQNLIQIIKKKL